MSRLASCLGSSLQNKYKEKCRQEVGSGVFHQMPETKEMEFVKQISELQSEVRRSRKAQTEAQSTYC